MIASLWEPLVIGTLVFSCLVVVGMATAAFVLWRYARRKLRAFHAHGAVIGAMALWDATSGGFLRPRAPMSSTDASQWRAAKVRKEMWRAVDQAEAAVRAADQVDAPIADMPSLCRRLRSAAIGLDQVLRVEPAGPVPAAVAAQAAEIARAARDLQQAAVASASDATARHVADLTRDAGSEIELLDAGVASARAVLPRTRP